nr:MAG TPA: hypothetical protein [Caudoviricetes sp.]
MFDCLPSRDQHRLHRPFRIFSLTGSFSTCCVRV